MYLIVGLGNPGKKYDLTRHNIGFNVIDILSNELSINVNSIKHKSLVGSSFINGEKVMLVKPQTFMNLSGEAVRDIVEYYEVDLDKVMIVYDDVDTEIGSIRIKRKGSGGSHNGMNNIIYLLKDDRINRLRFGIGRSKNISLKSYVLGKFEAGNIDVINDTINKSVEAIKVFIYEDADKAMNRYNG